LCNYCLHRAKEYAGAHGLILVEGFFDAMWLWQAGIKNAVALMGSSLSPEQEALIVQ
jgi:DNA primase